MEKNLYTNIRVLKEDAKTLKLVSALAREKSMLETFHRLVEQEHQRLRTLPQGGPGHDHLQKDQT